MTDLFSPPAPAPRAPPRDDRAPPKLPMIQTAEGLAYVTARDDCHACAHWARNTAATGFCHRDGQGHPMLTSYAHSCLSFLTNLGR